jgi:hypothetical protein
MRVRIMNANDVMRWALVGLWATLAATSAGCGEDEATTKLCTAGQEIFCRCPDDSPGTRTCSGDGKSVSECGPCDGSEDFGDEDLDDDFDDPPPDEEDPGSSGEPGGPGDGRPLFAVCTEPTDCESGMCELGYCTRACDKPSECSYPEGECVSDGQEGRCLAACKTDDTCSTFGLACDDAVAIDGWHVNVCR